MPQETFKSIKASTAESVEFAITQYKLSFYKSRNRKSLNKALAIFLEDVERTKRIYTS